jgi:MFS family permease
MDKPTQSQLAALLMLIVLSLITVLCVRQQLTPDVVPDTAAATAHSSQRAMAHLRQIARKPHPIGSDEHRVVRDYIFDTLTGMGVEVELQSTVVWRSRGDAAVAATVDNVVARLRGSGDGSAILLDAHYDSVAMAPGAADDAAAVAVLLETLRAVQAGPPLTNDLILLINDAEEVGLLGTKAFIDQHPWAEDVRLVLNLEARGSSGPSLMFQTSPGNAGLIRALAEAAPDPVATSLSHDVYKLLPNDTNFSIYRRAGHAGYDFAFVDQVYAYHTELDSVELIDERSLQHHGSYTLSLVRHFGAMTPQELAQISDDQQDSIYFNILGHTMVRYPAVWAMHLAVLLAILTVAVIVLAMRRKRATAWGLLKGGFLSAATILVTAVAIWLLRWLVLRLDSGSAEMLSGEPYNGKLYAAAAVCLALAIFSWIFAWTRKRWVNATELALGAAFLWLIGAFATAAYLTGGSYLFSWPLLFALAGITAHLLLTSDDDQDAPVPLILLLGLLAIPLMLLLTPIVTLLFTGLTWSMAHVVIVLPAAGLCLLALQLDLIRIRDRRPTAAIAAVACLGFLVAAGIDAGFSPDRPRPNSLAYSLDADEGSATWTSYDRKLDAWTSQALAEEDRAPRVNGVGWQAPAPVLSLPSPEVEVVDDQTTDGVRRLRLLVRSPRKAPILRLRAWNDLAQVLTMDLDDCRLEADQPDGNVRYLRLTYYAPPAEGIEVALAISAGEPLQLNIEDESYGLPAQLGLQPRTEAMMPKPTRRTDRTTIRTTFQFE